MERKMTLFFNIFVFQISLENPRFSLWINPGQEEFTVRGPLSRCYFFLKSGILKNPQKKKQRLKGPQGVNCLNFPYRAQILGCV